MKLVKRTLPIKKNIALIAHDHCKANLLDWCRTNKATLQKHHLFATGTTGVLIEKYCEMDVTSFLSGPMGGDQQIGAKIAEREIDILIFFWDPLNAVSHDPDVKALLRLAVVWNIPFASNRATADALMGSDLFKTSFIIDIPDYKNYLTERTQ